MGGIKTFEQRLEGKWYEDGNGCHVWTACKNAKGYARLSIGYAHRMAFIHRYGPLPPWLWCLHTCHNSSCINPEHLYLGDHEQNMKDMVDSGRSHRGVRRHNAKISEADVLRIRALRDSGCRVNEIARMYGLRHQQISNIVNRVTWKHI